jgi:hypothetical protein
MTKSSTPKPHFMSVFAPTGDYAGCAVLTCRGWRGYDALDRHVGYHPSPDAAHAALLEKATGIST